MVAGNLGVMDNMPGAAGLGMKPSSVEAATITDLDILNFALNLEYMEAEFYTMSTTGKTLEESGFDVGGTGTPGPTTGGQMIDFNVPDCTAANLGTIAAQITADEQTHVKVLRAALGNNAVAKPAINLNALGAYSTYQQFLVIARAFEDTGSSAYGGAAPLLTSKTYRAGAVQIGMTEVYHAGNLRLQCAAANVPTFAVDSKDFPPPPTGSKYFDVNQFAMGVVRTASQVLAIVFHNSTPGTNKGGFFPSGVNGPINTV